MQQNIRRFSLVDSIINEFDKALNHIFCEQKSSRRYPAESLRDEPLDDPERRLSAGLMRVNHAGEMAAQALYQGQSLTARDPELAQRLRQASIEESDHLNWCRTRLTELDDRPSLLDPFWYMGSLVIGMSAGLAGDRWNLGFLSETEYQVVRHLEGHLERLPKSDKRSRAIVEQMRTDELGHARLAEDLGAAPLPSPVRQLMRLTAKVMTTLAERV